jgi:YfiH family protein
MIRAPFYSWREHFGVELAGARALFTTRRGGFSTGPYQSLNLGRLTDDAPEAVERNRNQLEQQVERALRFVRQVHGVDVHRAMRDPNGAPEADGLLVAGAGLAGMVTTADCLPIAVAGRSAAAILHAGWRGLAGGIIGHGVSALQELTPDEHLQAAIGPGAGPCCYEVSEDVHSQFADLGPAARRGQNLDLKAIARHQLTQAGVETVHDISLCTICAEPSLFFSHRRDRGVTGRQAGVIWLS